MNVKAKKIILPLEAFFSALILTWISLYLIENPDLDPYISLFYYGDRSESTVEPTMYLLAFLAKSLSSFLSFDPILIFYFNYIFLLQVFLLFGFYNIAKQSIANSNILIFLWLLIYGVMHCLIQIRFGLANAIFVYIFSLFYSNKSFLNTYLLGFFGILTHYSSIFAIFVLFYLRVKGKLFQTLSYKLIHLSFIVILLSFKFSLIFSILPDFIYVRLNGYLTNDELEGVSIITSIISFICYSTLMLCPKLNDEKLNCLRIYGALGFLPYFITPELEILVRLGIPFQYLLLIYLFLTFKVKKVAVLSTIPLLAFYSYKIFSSVSAFIGYLK
ncbi:EpsG family protein [Acinetobacter johnsonii]|nr:EpsG family protein [Acinetobacter johnsonii]